MTKAQQRETIDAKGRSRETCMHICFISSEKLPNGTSTILDITHRVRDEDDRAFIDTGGYLRSVKTGNHFHRDFWKLK